MAVTPVRIGTMEYLVSDAIGVTHCFTTRLGGVSRGHLASLNIGVHRGDDPACVRENYRLLCGALGILPEDLVLTRQTHSDVIRAVGQQDRGLYLAEGASPQCDALITAEPGVALAVFTADCTPVLLHDPVTGAVGAVHAGWRGTAADIAGKTVRAMVAAFGCDPNNIRAAIGPNIGPCCFETGEDVPQAMEKTYGQAAVSAIRPANGKYFVDLKRLNALSLENAGVHSVDISPLCTACDPVRFWSYRRMGDARGAQGAVIVCGEGKNE